MTTQEVANRLVELCRKGQILEAQAELYGASVVSIEPDTAPVPRTEGLQAVTEKGKYFASTIEERHDGYFGDPIVSGSYFSITAMLDATIKGRGRMKLEEICVYKVENGKIVLEQFFY